MPKQKPNEQVQQIPLSEIRPFKNHPFKVTDDELMQQTIDSIMQVGVLNPAIIRPAPEGGYEMVAGHRRLHAADLAGLKTIPAIVRNLDDDEAVILMVDSNLQRETISPMERAQAYKMKLEALKHQGKRVDLVDKSTSRQVGEKSWAVAKVGADANESERQVHRYIRLTELLPEVQKKVDSKEIAFSPAVELSYLTRDEQKQFLDAMDYSQNTPSLSQAQRLKKLSREGKCTQEAMRSIMSEEKKEEQERITLSSDCCDECGVYDDDLEKSPEVPYEDAPDTEDDSEETELSIAEAEAVVKAVAELLFPFLPAEIDEGGGAHEGI